jgi:hypothetical protein
MILVAVEGLLILFGPARIGIFLALFGRILLPLGRDFSLFDLIVLVSGVSLPWHLYKAGVYNATRIRYDTFAFQ